MSIVYSTICLTLPAIEKVCESLDWHIGHSEQFVKHDSKCVMEFLLVFNP